MNVKIAHATVMIVTVNKGNKRDRKQHKIQTDVLKKGARQMAFEYEIVKHIATLGEANDRTLEVNLVSWNKRPAKVDIRRWDKDHTFMGKGVALTDEEAKALLEALKGRYEV